MAFAYRPVDRDQGFLLPPSMKDWLPPEHLVWFVLGVVDQLDTSAFHDHRRGGDPRGAAAYDPDMLLAVLIYAYARGVRSSREIARLCEVDVAFRVACGQDAPSHQTMSRFVVETEAAVTVLFGQVLRLCAAAGMVRLGVVAIDGTKIAASAAGSANRTRGWVQRQAERLVAEHQRVDVAEDAEFGERRGDELPVELADPVRRAEAIRRAMDEVRVRDADRAAQAQARDRQPPPAPGAPGRPREQDRVAHARARLERVHAQAQVRYEQVLAGRQHAQAVPPERYCQVRAAQQMLDRALLAQQRREARSTAGAGQEEQVNLTDPQSRLMKSARGWVQGYNCQFAVTEDHIMLAARVTQDVNDCQQFQPMMTASLTAAAGLPPRPGLPAQVGTMLADAGYFSVENVTTQGPDRLIATGKRSTLERPDLAEDASGSEVKQQMRRRLATPEGQALYRRRGPWSNR
jgi:transposase